jgi:aspartate aminotransferase-like enzyme
MENNIGQPQKNPSSATSSSESWPYSLLAPGPVNLSPEVQASMGQSMIHHRTPRFDKVLANVLSGLRFIFQTSQPVFAITCTGSGGMEALIVNCLNPGDKVLAIVSGKFGERWSEMAKTFGTHVTEITVPWGQAVQVSEVEKYLQIYPDTNAVLCQACETSTAVAHPIQELGQLISKYPNTLFLVDGITALGAFKLPMDEFHIDGLVGGSQKAFMLPTGMAFMSLSKKAWKKCETVTTPRYYFDLRKELKANQKGETFFSSNVLILRALEVIIEQFKQQGLEHLYSTIARRAEFTRWLGAKLNLQLYSQSPSNSLTAWSLPESIDGVKLRELIETKYNITLMGGQDQLKGKILRIGHMGYITDVELLRLSKATWLALTEVGHKCGNINLTDLEKEAESWLAKRKI